MDGPEAGDAPLGDSTDAVGESQARMVSPADPSPASGAEERELVDRARGGDLTALALLFESHYSRVYRYLRFKVTRQEDAEDLAQEVFLRMLDGLKGYQHRGAPFRAWLMQIAENLRRDFYRRRGGAAAAWNVDIEAVEIVGEDDPAHAVEVKLQMERVSAAMPLLTETEREVVLLRYVAELSVAETAALTGKSGNNVKQLTFKAINKLKKALNKEDAGDSRA